MNSWISCLMYVFCWPEDERTIYFSSADDKDTMVCPPSDPQNIGTVFMENEIQEWTCGFRCTHPSCRQQRQPGFMGKCVLQPEGETLLNRSCNVATEALCKSEEPLWGGMEASGQSWDVESDSRSCAWWEVSDRDTTYHLTVHIILMEVQRCVEWVMGVAISVDW